MNLFTHFAIIAFACLGAAFTVAALAVAFSRGYTLRRYEVIDVLGVTRSIGGNYATSLGLCFSFRGAHRLAQRTRGARIFNTYSRSFAITRCSCSAADGDCGNH